MIRNSMSFGGLSHYRGILDNCVGVYMYIGVNFFQVLSIVQYLLKVLFVLHSSEIIHTVKQFAFSCNILT